MQAVDARLVTPEAVLLQFETAGLGSRFLARILDILIQIAGVIALGFVVAGANAAGTGATFLAITFFFGFFCVLFVYPAAVETLWRGRTVGKAALGLRVVTREGAPIRFRHAAIRSALFLIDGMILGPTIGVLCLLFSRDNQRLGDLASGAIVVRERSGAKAPVATSFAVPMGCDAYVASLDVTGLGAEEYEAVRAMLLRGPTLQPHIRYDLARQVATLVTRRLRHTPPSWAHPELYLACVAAAFQRRFTPAYAGPQLQPPWGPPAPPAPPGAWGVAPPRPPEASPEPPPASGGGFAPPG